MIIRQLAYVFSVRNVKRVSKMTEKNKSILVTHLLASVHQPPPAPPAGDCGSRRLRGSEQDSDVGNANAKYSLESGRHREWQSMKPEPETQRQSRQSRRTV